MRQMLFSHTAAQVRERLQTVTRRPGWRFSKPGDLILAVDAVRRAETDRRSRALAVLRIVDVRIEPLARLVDDPRYAEDELPREGFPCWSRDDFIARFLRTHRLSTVDTPITRIEFAYAEPEALRSLRYAGGFGLRFATGHRR